MLRLRKWVLVRTCSLDQVLSEVGETGLGARVLEAAAAKNAKGHAKRAGHCCGQSSAPGGIRGTYKRRQGVMRICGTAGKATYGVKRQLSAGRPRLGLALSTASRAAVVGVAARATRSVGRAWSRARLDRVPATMDSEEIVDDLDGEGLLRPRESPPVACFSRASEVRLSSGRSINNALTAPTKPLLAYSCTCG